MTPDNATPLSAEEVDRLEKLGAPAVWVATVRDCAEREELKDQLARAYRERDASIADLARQMAEVCDMLNPEWRGKFSLKQLVQENIDSWHEQASQLAAARKDTERLRYYFTFTGSARPSAFVALEMRTIAGEEVPLEEWLRVIDEGMDAAREKEPR